MKIGVMVLGGHRSGTSATAGVLCLSGVDFGTNLTPPREENPHGFFEHDDVWKLHERLLQAIGVGSDEIRALPKEWCESHVAKRTADEIFSVVSREFSSLPLWGLKDPRLSRLFPLWPGICGRLGAEPRVVISLRHPLESALSLVRRNGFDLSHSLALWLRYMLDAERATRGYRRALLHYPDLLADWREAVGRLNCMLDLGLPAPSEQQEKDITSFISIDLRHHRAGRSWVSSACPTPFGEWCEEVYQAMLIGPDGAGAATLDNVAAALEDLECRAGAFWAPVNHRNGEIRRLSAAVEALQAAVAGNEVSVVTGAPNAQPHTAAAEAATERTCAERASLNARIDELAVQLQDARSELEAVYRSRSWRITRPLRAATRRIRKLRIARPSRC